MMPAIIPLEIDSDAIMPGTVYSDESLIIEADDLVTMTHEGYTDMPGMTIVLTLNKPATVLQLAQVNFACNWERDAYFDEATYAIPFVVRPACNDDEYVGVERRTIRATAQNVFVQALWPGLSAGAHVFKLRCTQGRIEGRKHALIIMRL